MESTFFHVKYADKVGVTRHQLDTKLDKWKVFQQNNNLFESVIVKLGITQTQTIKI